MTVEKLRQIAKQANIHLPTSTPSSATHETGGEEEEEGEASGSESGEDGVLRGVNEVLRFVQALDRVNVDGVEPMWTPLPPSHAAPLRDDQVAGSSTSTKKRRAEPAAAVSARGGLESVGAEEGAAGWSAASRDDLIAMAPDSSRSPYYVSQKTAQKTAGTTEDS